MAIGANPSTASRGPGGKDINVTRRRRRGSLTCGISKRTTFMLVDYTQKQANLSPNSLSRLNSLVEGDIRRKPQHEEEEEYLEESKVGDLPVGSQTEEYTSFEDSLSSTSSHHLSTSNKQSAALNPSSAYAPRRMSSSSLSNSNQSNLSSSEHSIGLERVFEEKITAAAEAKQALYCISVSLSEDGEKVKFSLRNPEVLKAVRNALNESREKLNASNGQLAQPQAKPTPKLKRQIKCHIPHDRFKLPQIKAVGIGEAGNVSRRFSNAGTVVSAASTTNMLQCIEEEESDNIMAEMSQQRMDRKPSLMDSCESFAIDTLDSSDEEEEVRQHSTVFEGENESDTEADESSRHHLSKTSLDTSKKESLSKSLTLEPEVKAESSSKSVMLEPEVETPAETEPKVQEAQPTKGQAKQPNVEEQAAAAVKAEPEAKNEPNNSKALAGNSSFRGASSLHNTTLENSVSCLYEEAAKARRPRRASLHVSSFVTDSGAGFSGGTRPRMPRRASLAASSLADSFNEEGSKARMPRRGSLHSSLVLSECGSKSYRFGASMPSLMFMGGEYGTSESDICPSSQQNSETSLGFGSESNVFSGQSESEYDSRSELGDSQSTYGDGSQSQFSVTDRAYDADNTEVGDWNEDGKEVALVDDSLIGHGFRRTVLQDSESEEEYEEDLFNEDDHEDEEIRDETEAGEGESQSAADASETDGSLVTTATDESSQAGLNYGLSQYLSTHSRSGHSSLAKKMTGHDSQTVTSITASMTTGFQSMDASGQSSIRSRRSRASHDSSSRSFRSAKTFHSQRTSKSAPTVLDRQDSITSMGNSSRGDLDDTGHDSLRFDELSKASSAPLDSSSRRRHMAGDGSSRRHHSQLLDSSYGKLMNASASGQASVSALDHSDADSSVASSVDKRRKRRSTRRHTMLGDSSSMINRSFRASKTAPDGKIPRSNTPQGVLLRTRSGDGLPSRSIRHSIRSHEERRGVPSRTKSMDGSILASSRRGSHSSRHRSSAVSISSQGTERSRGVNRTKSRDSFMGGSRIKKWGGSSANKSGHGLSLLEQHLTKGSQQTRRSKRPSNVDKRQNSSAEVGSLPSLARSLRS